MNIRSFEYTIDVMEADEAQNESNSKLKQPIKLQFEKLNLSNLSFQFDHTKLILDDVSIQINKGDVIGLMGESGSGKSSLMNIMLGFYKPSSGAIFLNSEKLTEDLLPEWHHLIGYVSQDVFMMDATILENVAFGIDGSKADLNRVWECLQMAQMASFVEKLEGQLSFNVGERGGRLSGGQRQRLGIARALYSGAQVLFFDEATASLDQETEREITETIQELAHLNLTVVMIAHRLTTLKHCNRVIKISKGKITQEYNAHEFKQKFLNVE